MKRYRANTRRGFTLLEASLATMIIGIGVVATFRLFAACTQQNSISTRMTSAMMLAENIHEAMVGLAFNDPGMGTTNFDAEPGETLFTYDDVDDFHGETFNPPINSNRNALNNLAQYSQVVSVWPVHLNNLETNSNESAPDLTQTSYTGAVRVRVRVLYQATPATTPVEIYRQAWIRVDN
jgi:prepilin-type N-terminal cleavage/methylation domain-containing protein